MNPLMKHEGGGKTYCYTCGFRVNPSGHELRCKPKPTFGSQSAAAKSKLRRQSWLGDVVHKTDIRLLLLCDSLNDTELEPVASKFTSNTSMANYMKKYESGGLSLHGLSDHSVASIFEASYHGDFRSKYLSRMFPTKAINSAADVPHEYRAFFEPLKLKGKSTTAESSSELTVNRSVTAAAKGKEKEILITPQTYNETYSKLEKFAEAMYKMQHGQESDSDSELARQTELAKKLSLVDDTDEVSSASSEEVYDYDEFMRDLAIDEFKEEVLKTNDALEEARLLVRRRVEDINSRTVSSASAYNNISTPDHSIVESVDTFGPEVAELPDDFDLF